MKIYDTKVNHMTNPLGFYMPRTVFSWKVKEAAGKTQTRARIKVAGDAAMENVISDSGWLADADSMGTKLEFALRAGTRYYWTVTVHTDADEEETCDVQWFETAKMDEPWDAAWITCDSTVSRHPVFSKEIALRGGVPVSRARLYICGLGVYEAFYNGERIGDEYLTPYCNDYNEWVQYQTFDVTGILKNDGILSVMLGNGWYKGRFGYWSDGQTCGFYGNEWKLIAELHIEYTDGAEDVIGTDESWKVTRSRITFSNIYDGEYRDDTLEDIPEETAVTCAAPAGELTERLSPPVKIQEKIKSVELLHTPAGEQVFDLGQEITGIFELRVNEPAGTRIRIQTGEILQGGNFFRDNLRGAKSEYVYISDGTEKLITPHFTFYGYRYVKVEGAEGLSRDDLTGIVLHSEMERTGYVETGHERVNKLISNVTWGMRGNFLDVPTDCPQRDERMGWTGDAEVFAPTAMYLYDTYAFYAKYLYDMKKEQKALGGKVPDVVPSCGVETCACAWGDACCIIPWRMYQVYGDKSILEDQFDSMRDWVDYIRRVDGDSHAWRYIFHFGDWLALDNLKGGAEETKGATDEEFIANLYYANSADIVSKAAAVLGLEKEAEKYRALAGEQFAEIKREYYSVTGRCCIKTQTALLLTLKHHLSDNNELTKRQLTQLFEDSGWKLKTGFIGTPLLLNVLTDNDMTPLAFSLLLNEEYPGWLYEVNLGATTVWERWNSLLPDGTVSGISMNSMNHYAYGSVLEWIFRHAAGINTDDEEAGTRHMKLMPELNPELGRVKGCYDSPAGLYSCSWELDGPKKVTVNVTVPFGCSAGLKLPHAPESVYADDRNPMFKDVRDGICRLEPGSYSVTYELTGSLRREYTLDTPIRELLQDPDIVARLEKVLPLNKIPQQYYYKSIRQMTEEFASSLTEEDLKGLEKLLV